MNVKLQDSQINLLQIYAEYIFAEFAQFETSILSTLLDCGFHIFRNTFNSAILWILWNHEILMDMSFVYIIYKFHLHKIIAKLKVCIFFTLLCTYLFLNAKLNGFTVWMVNEYLFSGRKPYLIIDIIFLFLVLLNQKLAIYVILFYFLNV